MMLAAALAVCAAAAVSAGAAVDQPVAVLRVQSVGGAVDRLGRTLTAPPADGRARVSLGVVFDSTGSMFDDLRQLIRGVDDVLKVVVASDSHIIENFILVPYHDPVIGPAMVTDDYQQFYDSLKLLDVRGGGDCPEMALTGLKLALEEALPGSHIYVFTDASAKDHHLLEEVMSLISDKSPHIVFVLTGDCDDPDGPGQTVFRRIAAVTSGHVFHLKKDSVQQVLAFVRESLRPRKVSLAAVDHRPNSSTDEEDDESQTSTINFHVDKTLDEFTVSVSGNRPEVVIRESQNQENITGDLILDLPKVKVVNIRNPKPGRYDVMVDTEDAAFTLRATAISGLNFEFGFTQEERGQLANALDRPAADKSNYLLVRTLNANDSVLLGQAELTSLDGQLLQTVPLGEREPDGVHRGGPFSPPEDLFRIKVHGSHQDGSSLQRETSAVSAVHIGKPTVVAEAEVTGHLGSNVSIPCRVRSYLPMSAGWFMDNEPLTTFDKYSQSSRSRRLSLQLANLKLSDAGTYTCYARNALGKAFQSVQLAVLEPPPEVKTTRNTTVLEGRPVYLACDVTSQTPYNVTWSRAEWYHGRRPIRRPDTTDYLHIRAASLNDAGRYQCTATNEGGSVTSETTLAVHAPPKVSVSTPGSVFLPRQQVVLICQAYGNPHPDVVWTRDFGAVVATSEDGRVEVERGLLRISNATAADENVYTCMGTNPYGTSSASLYIQYAEPPRVKVSNRTEIASIGHPATLACNVTGKPTPSVTWLRASSPLQMSRLMKTTSTVAGTVTTSWLHFVSVQSSDTGTYTCSAESDYGRDTAAVSLAIGSPPRIIIADYDVSLMYGASTTLPCVAVGSPDPTVSWSRHDSQLANVDDTGTLTINHALVPDSGVYICTAVNKYGTDTLHVNVTVLGIVAPLLMELNPVTQTDLHSSLSIHCNVLKANPTPTFRWRHDGLPVVNGGGRRLLSNGTLLLSSVRQRDEGLYQCTAQNVAGSTSVSTHVNVQFAPDIVADQGQALEAAENSTVFLPCEVSADPAPRVLWVKHGHLIVPLNGRLRVHANNTLQITDITEDDGGLYTCHVNNTRGEASTQRRLVVHAPPRIVRIEADVAVEAVASADEQYVLELEAIPRLERRGLPPDIDGATGAGDSSPALTVNEGDQVTILCDLRPDDVARVTWQKPGSLVDTTEVDNGGIRFAASEANEGTYMCTASNKYGASTAPVTLKVRRAPRSSDRLFNATAVVGDELSLSCVVRGRPKPRITWFRHNVRITDHSHKYRRSGNSLIIHDVQLSDGGLYTCIANNSIGSLSKLTNVTVHAPPSITGLVGQLAVRDGTELRLQASVVGTPSPDVHWLKDGQPFTPSSVAATERPGQLIIPSVTSEDSGKYVLVAKNTAGEALQAIKVKVVSLVVNDQGWRDSVEVIDGEDFKMLCPVSGDVTSIKWLKNGQGIAESFTRTRADQTHVVIGDGGRYLRIPEVTAEDSGQYTCVAETEADSVDFSQGLVVLVPPRFANPFHDSQEKVIDELNQLKLDCRVSGLPKPLIRWFRDGQPILDAGVQQGVTLSADGGQLTVRGRLETAGVYRCEVTNSAGRAQREFPVRVEVAPRPAGPDPQLVTVFRGDSVTLNCSVVGAPTPGHVWNKDNQQVVGVPWIASDSGLVYYPLQGERAGRLLVAAARLADAGQFQCVGKNRLGKASRRIILTVNGAPIIDGAGDEVQRLSTVPGTSVTLPCPVQSFPLAAVTWTKDGEVVKVITPPVTDGIDEAATELPFVMPASSRRRRDIAAFDPSDLIDDFSGDLPDDGSGDLAAEGSGAEDVTDLYSPGDTSLVLSEISAADDGLYTCTASNQYGRASIQTSVQVLESPTILDAPLERRVNMHDSETLRCETTGTPPPVVSWLKDGVPVSELSIPHLYESDDPAEVLVLLASPEMAGTYTCVATNPAGQAIRDTQLIVVEPPEISVPAATDLTVVETHSQTLTCEQTSAVPATISWLHNGRPLTELEHRLTDKNHTLVLSSLGREDTGDFTCLAANQAGHDELTYTVQVLVPPYFEDDVTEYKEKVHRSIALRCLAIGIPAPEIAWSKGEEPLQTSADGAVLVRGSVVRISRLQLKHAGTYRCRATNELSEASQTVSLAVLEPPVISALEPSLVVAAGASLRLPCSASGTPPPQVIWQLDGAPLPAAGQATVEAGTLSIDAASISDSGLYSCLAWNEVASDRADVFVAVVAPPTLDPADPEKIVLEHEATVIRCPLDALDLDTEITWRKDGVEVWTNSSSLFVAADDRALLLPAARLSDAGSYSCHARNEVGRVSHELQLRVLVPPRLKVYPDRLAAMEGDDVTIECELVASEPAAERIWRKNGLPVIGGGRVQLLPGGDLQLLSVTVWDIGSYTCRAHNSAGEAVRRAALDVLTLPTATVQQDTVTVLEGDPLRLMCDASGNPEPDVSWSLVGQMSPPAPLSEMVDFAPFMASDNHIYKRRVELGDAGVYRCQADSPLGRAAVDVQVSVISPPAFVDASVLTEVVARAGQSALFNCRTSGTPPPQVVWLRDGMELPHMDGADTATLSLPSLAPADGGQYVCVAVNQAGTLSRQFTLRVLSAPSIMRSENTSIEAPEGSSVEMSCFVESMDTFNITWFKDSEEFSPSLSDMYHLTDGGQTLHVLRADEGHEASYSCLAASVAGHDTQTFALSVLTPARISRARDVEPAPDGTFPMQIPIGSERLLECLATGDPPPTRLWIRDGQVLDLSGPDSDDSVLVLTSTSPDDSGRYTCHVNNSLGEDSVVYTVQVYALPKLSRELEYSVNARLRANATLTCDVTGHPTPQITWYKDGLKLESHLQKLELTGQSLVVRDLGRDDTGNYSCFAVNSAGLLVVPFELLVFEPPRVSLPEHAVAVEGRDLELQCTATGEPTPTVTWTREGRSVGVDGRVRALAGKLTVQDTGPIDGGEYQCFSKNRAGTDRAEVFLDIIEVPRLETFDAEEQVETLLGVPLSLPCPVDTDFLGEFGVEWLRGSEPLKDTSYQTDGLELLLTYPVPEDAGEITCRVSNAAGSVQYLFRLNVVHAPRLTSDAEERAEPLSQVEGLPLVLVCQAEANPPPTIIWYNKSWPIIAESARLKFPSSHEILLEEVTPADAESLSCKAQNAHGIITQTFSLDVLTVPKVSVPAEVEVKAGDVARVPCHVSGNPEPTRVWYTGDDAISLPPGATSDNYAHAADTGELVVAAASLDDLGVYTCVASSYVGSGRSQVALQVLAAPSIEGTAKETKTVVVGGSVVFRCPISGHPPPTITWYKDEDALRRPDGLGDGGQTLTLRQLTAAAAGQYGCVAASRAGTARKLFQLRVNEMPRIRVATEEVEVAVSEPLTLRCPSAGPGVFSTVWLRRGRPVGRASQFTLPQVQEKDAGKYQCISSSLARSRITKYNIRVKVPPRVVKDTPPATVVRPQLGYPLRLTCPIDGAAPVRWRRRGELLTERDGVIVDGRLLFVFSVAEEDSGQYSCEASNSAGKAAYHFDVLVVVAPYFEPPGPNRVTVMAGDNFTLKCDVIGLPKPNVTWYKDASVVSRLRRLRFLPLDVSADGVYTCSAENEAGSAERQFILDVLEPPVISGPPAETVRVALGGSTVLPCVTKTVLASISWHLSGAPVSLLSPRLSLTPRGLSVQRARTSDRGKYRCTVENDAGRAERIVRLVVSAPAQVEEKSLYLVTGERMTLTCPKFDGASDPVEETAWTVKAQGSKKTNKVVRPIMKVAHVKLSHSGQYKCQVTSRSGEVKATAWNIHVKNAIDLHVSPPGPVTSSEGDELTLTCQTDSGAGVRLVWFRNDTQLDLSSGRLAGSASRTKGSVVVSSLVIDDVAPADMGQYVCRAEAGDVTAEQTVMVQVTGPPRIASSSPAEQTLTPGQRLRLRCDVTGLPVPTLRWFRGQTVLEPAGRISLDNATLTVKPFQLGDAGEYMCVAVSAIGKAARKFAVVARMAPTFTETPKDVVVPKMGKAPPPRISWLRNGQSVGGHSAKMSHLSVHLAGPDDAGEYTCQAASGTQVHRASATITVFQRLGPPKLVAMPKELRLRAGRPGQLACRSTTKPTPAIRWQKNGQDFSGDGVTTTEDDGQVLVFSDPRSSDAGLYRCLATNAAGLADGRVKVVVERPPVIMERPPTQIAVPNGSPVTLPCVSSGWPRPDILWERDSRPLPQSDQLRQLADGSLVLAAVGARLVGRYSCIAKNEIGTDTARVHVTLEKAALPAVVAFVPGPTRLAVQAGRPVTLCRVAGLQPDRHLLRVSRDGVSVPLTELRRTATGAQVALRLPAVADRHAGTYTCDLIDHTTGHMWKQQLQLEVDNGWDQWSECSITCGTGVRARNRDCDKFRPCQETAPCILPACTPRLRTALGSIHGEVNSVEITDGQVISKVYGDPDLGRLETLITNVEQEVTPMLLPLLPLLTPVTWLTAQKTEGAKNGLELTGGLFRKQTDIMFPTGQKLRITHTGLGVDADGTLMYNTEIRGHLPEVPSGDEVVPAQFKGDLVQTNAGDLHSHSTQYYQAGGTLVPFVVNETISYDGARGQMNDLVQSLDVDNTEVVYDVTANRVLFRMTSLTAGKSDTCPSGFDQVQDGSVTYCEDEDECLDSPCSHQCVNIVSSFRCECPAGFTVRHDRVTCEDVDECTWGMSDCESDTQCENTPGSYRCVQSCGPGLRKAPGASGCYDIDECMQPRPPCDQLCHNTRGNYSCDCYRGYQLVAGGRCVDIDECNQMLGACSHRCINIPGSYRCTCPAGLRLLPNGKCTDIDECATKTHNCYYDEQCVNTAASFKCVRPCRRGYKLQDNGVCADIDECAKMMDRCHYSQQCRNLAGSYRCVCPPGFRSDGPGFPCTDINECSIAGTCQHNCTNLDGGYLCTCPSGYRLNHNKRTCDDIDECSENGVRCAADHTCFNQRGSYSCTDVRCPAGFVRDPGTSMCLRPCRRRSSQCIANTWYSKALSYKLLALPAGVRARQDVVELGVNDLVQPGGSRQTVVFRLGDKSGAFAVQQRAGRGVVTTLRPLPPGSQYKLQIHAFTLNRQTKRWKVTTEFVVVIAVSKYPY